MLTGSAAYAELTERVAYVAAERDVIVATGRDTVTFLHSQLSQDIGGLAIGVSGWSFLLQPQGKPVAFLRVTRLGDDAVLLDTDAGTGEAVAAALTRFKIRTKCDLDLRTGVAVRAVRGPATPEWIGLGATWAGWSGADLFDPAAVPEADVRPVPSAGSDPDRDHGDPGAGGELGPEVDAAVFEAVRIERGVPRNGHEVDESVIPAETGAVGVAVSFTKGCYTGQELVERIDSRGHVNRVLRGLDIDTAGLATAALAASGLAGSGLDASGLAGSGLDASGLAGSGLSVSGLAGSGLSATGAVPGLARGTEVTRPGEAKAVGRVTSVAPHPVRPLIVALAYMRREVEPGDLVEVAGRPATVRLLLPPA